MRTPRIAWRGVSARESSVRTGCAWTSGCRTAGSSSPVSAAKAASRAWRHISRRKRSCSTTHRRRCRTRTPAGGDMDRAGLYEVLDGYLHALGTREARATRWAEAVLTSENNVMLEVGDGLWGTIDAFGA